MWCKYCKLIFPDDWSNCNECGEPLISDEEYEAIKMDAERKRKESVKREYEQRGLEFDDNIYAQIQEEEKRKNELYYQQKLSEEIARHDISHEKKEMTRPQCPTCHSHNLEKIGAFEKAVSIGMFGIFSNKRKYQFRCKDCGYMW